MYHCLEMASPMTTEEERLFDTCAESQAFRAECERKGWRTGRFARARKCYDSPSGLGFSNPPEGAWWLLCWDSDGPGGEKVPTEVVRAAMAAIRAIPGERQ